MHGCAVAAVVGRVPTKTAVKSVAATDGDAMIVRVTVIATVILERTRMRAVVAGNAIEEGIVKIPEWRTYLENTLRPSSCNSSSQHRPKRIHLFPEFYTPEFPTLRIPSKTPHFCRLDLLMMRDSHLLHSLSPPLPQTDPYWHLRSTLRRPRQDAMLLAMISFASALQ